MNASEPLNIKSPDTDQFPVVGIGASAGGLEALEQFLGNIPKNSGMAFIVIQHLDPTKKGMLPELLQRVSKMPVHQVKDNMVLIPNTVYVIPPNKTMSVHNGILHLFNPSEARGLRLPVDFFFHSLAEDMSERSIGLILSGMGSDGSDGVAGIKEKNGIVMVQDPATAKFDSMPRNAIEAVEVDIVASPAEMAAILADFLKNRRTVSSGLDADIKDKSALEKIITLLRTHSGNDFSQYKENMIYRRIERRMSIHGINQVSLYVIYLQDNPGEVDILLKELLISVTNFFRDPEIWDRLKESVIPSIIDKSPEGSIIRVWVPGCSSGEEAYSLAMVFREAMDGTTPRRNLSMQIFATDLNGEAIEIARKGIFPERINSEMPKDRLSRFFVRIDDHYRINTEIREMIVFAPHNIIMHPPFTKIDLISCRNLLIYLNPTLQKKIFGLFYYSLKPGGIMVLGSSETPGLQNHLFKAIDTRLKIYERSVTSLAYESDNTNLQTRTRPVNYGKPATSKSEMSTHSLIDKLLLQEFSPAGVLVNENGDIIYITGHTGKYLEPAAGKANMNIFAMLRDELRNEFPAAFRQAILKKKTVMMQNIRVGINDKAQNVNIKIRWIDRPESIKGTVMVVFTDSQETGINKPDDNDGRKTVKRGRYLELEEELLRAREENQFIHEEMHTSHEELKSANEELQSTNEELQSANEELTTSKEELQSLNEELQTVNAELQTRIDQNARVNSDMKNLLNSTDIATLFLDKELHIRRYTNQTTKIFKLIKSDVGRPFTDLATILIYPEMADDAIMVLNTLELLEKQVQGKDGRWFTVRIMPYHRPDNKIDGLVITFINISNLKQAEEELQEKEQTIRVLLASSDDVIVKLSAGLNVTGFSSRAEQFFGRNCEDTIDRNWVQMFIPDAERKKTEQKILKLLKNPDGGRLKLQVITAGGTVKEVEWAVNLLKSKLKAPAGVILLHKIDD
jgi:two-component system, chemotaxis family, CheB/CheR fusion protein